MRRLLVLAVALVAVLGLVAPAMAQAPAPKVTITGLIDQVGTYTKNMSSYDLNLNRATDDQLYGRTRGRFDIIGEVGKVKGVLGLEIDAYYGQTGSGDSSVAGCVTNVTSGAITCPAVGSGAEGSFDVNTDLTGTIQVKWLYTEFPMFLVPNTTVRLGAQPFGAAATYKLAVYANGDYAGVNWVTQFAPGARLNLTYVQVEESLTGSRDILPQTTTTALSPTGRCTAVGDVASAACNPQARGDDFAIIASFDFSPFKGLDIKPMYSYFNAQGVTSGSSRQGRGGVSIAAGGPFAPIATIGAAGATGFSAGSNGSGVGLVENRHTLGVDARWTSGPFSLNPTVLYQFGDRDAVVANAAYGQTGSKANADISAWLVDVRAGFQVGPLTLSGMVLWTSGDPAHNNPYQHVGYFQPLDLDTGYGADWGTQIFSLGIDYYQILNGAAAQVGLNPGVAIGYDKYGRLQLGGKAAYAVTPALTLGAGVTANWTDKSVDTDGFLVANGGIQPQFVARTNPTLGARPQGDSDYLGTEVNASLTYRFAPGVAFDWAFGYLFAGNALGHRYVNSAYTAQGGANPPVPRDVGVNDVVLTTARVRFTF